jgi:hypothetical protein
VASRRHLFLAVTPAALGELNLARDIARELHDRGDEVVFLAPAAMAFLFEGTAIRHRAVDAFVPSLSRALPELIRQERGDTVVLVDAASVFLTLDTVWAVDPAFLLDLEVPVVALDVWDLPATDLRWDFGPEALPIPPRVLEISRRLVPVPFARPRRDGACYDALPALRPLPPEEKAQARRELGWGDEERVVLLLSSRWQLPREQIWTNLRRLAEHLPALALEAVAALGPRARVVHVGPEAFAGAERLGERYRWIAQLAPERFQRLMGAADLLLTFNTSATSTLSALARGLPLVLAVNSRGGSTVEAVTADMAAPAAEPVRRWLEKVVPLYPFRVWPLGLHGLLTPVLADNPFTDALRTVELLDWDALVGACHALLFDPRARADALERQAAYCATVRTLPRGADVLRAQL